MENLAKKLTTNYKNLISVQRLKIELLQSSQDCELDYLSKLLEDLSLAEERITRAIVDLEYDISLEDKNSDTVDPY